MSDYAERLNEANKQLVFTNIKGKEYAQVNQRILAFWSLFPTGRIITKKTHDDGTRCEFECWVYREEEDEKPTVTGHAYETRQGNVNETRQGNVNETRKGNVNSTSYVENCETSAIGRALGLLGIGATTAIASADEVLNAIAQQEAAQNRSKPQQQPQQTNQPPQQQPPAKSNAGAADEKKQAIARAIDLKQKAMLGGTSEEGINSWYEAQFGKVGMNRLTVQQLEELSNYLQTIINDQQTLKEAANVNQ